MYLPVEGLQGGQPIALSGPRQRIVIAPRVTDLSLNFTNGDSIPLAEGDELFVMRAAVRIKGKKNYVLSARAFAGHIGKAHVRLRLSLMDRDGRRGVLVTRASKIRLAQSRDDDPIISEIAYIAETGEPITHAEPTKGGPKGSIPLPSAP